MNEVINKYIDKYMEYFTPYKKGVWCYEDGILMTAIYDMYKATGEKKYYDFVYKFYNGMIGEDGQVTLSFAAAGSYVLSAIGDEYTDIVSPWLPVTVTAAPKSNDAGVRSVTVADIEAAAGENNTYTFVHFQM